jgi:hypothetical protein
VAIILQVTVGRKRKTSAALTTPLPVPSAGVAPTLQNSMRGKIFERMSIPAGTVRRVGAEP